jgi:hypothetical protein
MSDAKSEREPYSITRLNKEINDCIDSINTTIWSNVKAIADLTGHAINPEAHTTKLSSEDPAPMVKAFELVGGLKEALNQMDILLNNLGHDLNPEYYEKIKKKDIEPG